MEIEIKSYRFSVEQMNAEANKFKEVFLDAMLSEGHLTQEQVEKMNQYCMVIAEKSFFGKFWDKLWGDYNGAKIMVVKIIEKNPNNQNE
jgi:hypothetical protein